MIADFRLQISDCRLKTCILCVLLIAFALGSAPVTGWAQARPDFSGDWIRADSVEQRTVATVGDAGFRVGNMGSGWGSPLTLRQQREPVVVDTLSSGLRPCNSDSGRVALDGSVSRNTVMIRPCGVGCCSRRRCGAVDTLLIINVYERQPARYEA